MTGVHGLVYVLAGAVVVIVSLALGLENEQGFVLFFYIAVVFMAYGALKVLWKAWQHHSVHAATKKTMHKHLSKAQQEIAKKHPSFKGPHPSHQRKGQRFCWSCGSHVTPEDRFCPKCGARLQ